MVGHQWLLHIREYVAYGFRVAGCPWHFGRARDDYKYTWFPSTWDAWLRLPWAVPFLTPSACWHLDSDGGYVLAVRR